MDGTAIVFTHGLLDTPAAKTAHGLIRGTERYEIKALLDDKFAGQDAGVALDGTHRNIPVYPDIETCVEKLGGPPDYLIIGIANAGGKLSEEWLPYIKTAIRHNISIVNGMHQFMSETPEIADLAKTHGVQLVDVRKPKPREALHFWSGEIHSVTCPIIAVMGTDCAVGKRTTSRFLVEACQTAGINAHMIYTGQTGWMQGGKYGFVFDSTLNDFVSGELEHAIVSCYKETDPDIIFIEGQAALRNPSGPCGSEMLVSGKADGVILVHPPGRKYYKGWQHTGRKIPPLQEEIALVGLYGVRTLGVALNGQYLDTDQLRVYQQQFREQLGIPVVLPVEEGVAELVEAVKQLLH